MPNLFALQPGWAVPGQAVGLIQVVSLIQAACRARRVDILLQGNAQPNPNLSARGKWGKAQF